MNITQKLIPALLISSLLTLPLCSEPQKFTAKPVNKKEIKKTIGCSLQDLMYLTYDMLEALGALQTTWGSQEASAALTACGTCITTIQELQRAATDRVLGLVEADEDCCFTGASGAWLKEYRDNISQLVTSLQTVQVALTVSEKEVTAASKVQRLRDAAAALQGHAQRFVADFAAA